MNKNRVTTYTAIRDSNKNHSKRHKSNVIHSTDSQNEDCITQNTTHNIQYSTQNTFNQSYAENGQIISCSNQTNECNYINDNYSDISDGDLNGYTDDIENLLQELYPNEKSSGAKMLPPVIRYSKKWTLNITELSSQLWCERSIELTLITGIRPETKAMKEGMARHEVLEQLDHELVHVTITSNEEDLGIKMLNSITLLKNLLQTGKCREVWVFGTYSSYVLRGIVDQLEIVSLAGRKVVKISDTKTRRVKNEPSQAQKQLSALQVQAYYLLINDLKNKNVDFGKLYKYSELNPNKPFIIPELKDYNCLKMLEKHFLDSFEKLPEVYSVMEISYECEGEIFSVDNVKLEYNNLIRTIEYCLEFWDGNRSSELVQPFEAWKCKFCHLLDKCEESPYKSQTSTQSLANDSS